jgi:hypothetical protein
MIKGKKNAFTLHAGKNVAARVNRQSFDIQSS